MSTPVRWLSNEGRNDYDHPLAVPVDQGTESLNISLSAGSLGTKRKATTAVTLSGDSYTGFSALFRFQPGQIETDSELHFWSQDSTKKYSRITAGTVVHNLTLADNASGAVFNSSAAVLNGKIFVAYKSGVNRLHVYDPASSTTVLRRSGLAAQEVTNFVVVDHGSGSYPAVYRVYAFATRVKVGSVIVRQSNIIHSAAAFGITPTGAGHEIRITKLADTADGETHWVVYGSSSQGGPFYELAEIPVATTTYDDTALVSSYSNNPLGPTSGSNYPFPSVKAIVSDGERLIGFGANETSAGDSVLPVPGTVYFTPVIGSSTGLGQDEERFQDTAAQSDWIRINPNGGSADIGLSQPINGTIYVFQSVGITALVPTGQAQVPYRRQVVHKKYGAVSHASIVVGEDESGSPCVYFLDPRDGPRRISLGNQVQWCGKDVNTFWRTQINLNATSVVAHGTYNWVTKEVIWWVATGANNSPDKCLVFNTTLGRSNIRDVRYGWAQWTGAMGGAHCSCMFPPLENSSLVEVPYAGNATTLFRQDGANTTDHGAVAFQGYAQSKAWDWEPISRRKRLNDAYVSAKCQAATTLQQSVIQNWSAATKTDTVSIAAIGSETRCRVRCEATDVSDIITAQIQIGDAAAVAVAPWTIDRWDGIVESTSAK